MTDAQIYNRTYRRSADRPWLIWWGIEPAAAAMFRVQLSTYAIFLRTRIEVLSARANSNEEVWRGLRRIADEGWRIYRVRCEAIEAATIYNNYFLEPGLECLKAARILARCFDDATRSSGQEVAILRSDIDWLQQRYMGELLQKLRVIYCPLENVGHPLDMVFWHLTRSLGVGVDVSVFEHQERKATGRSMPNTTVVVP